MIRARESKSAPVGVVGKVLRILEALDAAPTGLQLREISQQTSLNKSTAYRFVAHLESEGYLFREPLSPHLAARLEGAAIDPDHLLAELARHRAESPGRALVVEGAGGLLVPLTGDLLLIDLLAAAGLPCLLVALAGLGTINHTLLSLEALRRRGLEVAGVVMNGPPDPENGAAIERYAALGGDRHVLPEALHCPGGVRQRCASARGTVATI